MYHTWQFHCKDGSIHYAKFTDEEIKECEKKYPEVKWTWNRK